MSPPTTVTTKERKEAPHPWLAAAAEQEGLPRQQWTPEIEEQTYFTLRFQPTIADHERCLRRAPFVHPEFLLYFVVYSVGVCALSITGVWLIDCWQTKQWVIPKSSSVFRGIMQAMGVCSLGPALNRVRASERVNEIRQASTSECVLTVSSAGMECEIAAKKIKLLYTQISSIWLNRGDLYLQDKRSASHLYVPASALPDKPSMEKLYETVYSLWTTNGSPSAVSDEARARFMDELGDGSPASESPRAK